MTASTIQFLNDQMRSDEVWMSDHRRAMQCANLEARIEVGLRLFELFRNTDELWSRHVQSGKTAFDPEVVKTLRESYEWWIRPCPIVFKEIAAFAKDGYVVKGANELSSAHQEANNVLKTDSGEVINGLQRARAA